MQCVQARAGRPFTLAVRAAIDAAQGDDPLRAVTVVVPSNLAGLSLRRLLGSDRLDPSPRLGPRGIANVSFATPFQLAGRLAAPELARSGRRPLTTAVLAAAVRHVLRTEPGRFAGVAEHVSTETALVRAYSELTELHPEQRAVLGASTTEQTADLLQFVAAVTAHLESDGVGHHDEYEVMFRAHLALEGGLDDDAAVVLCGPFDQGEATRTFLGTVARTLGTHAVLSLTGDPRTDDRSRQSFGRILGDHLAEEAVGLPRPTRMIPAADPDEEVRAVVREVLRRAEAGVPFERMAVFHPVQNPYARTLREQFDAAGIPAAGPDHRRMNDSMAGRLLRRILELAEPRSAGADHRLDRDNVLALAAAAPVRTAAGDRARTGPWEVVSRKAGVVGGMEDWNHKLGRHIESLTDTADDPLNEGRSAGFHDALRREIRSARELLDFVQWLDRETSAARSLTSWADRSSWAIELMTALLPAGNRRGSWPESEVVAADGVELVLRRVGVLDNLEPNAPWSAFIRAVELELDAPAGSRGRFGTGVLVAPMSAAVGLDVDHAFVLGLSEGTCPRVIREDTLLPDEERKLVGGSLARRPDRQADERRRFLSAVASGTESATLLMPIGDHRNGRVQSASRWWVEALRGLGAPDTLTASDWTEVDVAELEPIRSYREALTEAGRRGLATSRADLDLLGVDGWLHTDRPAAETPGIGRPLAASLRMLDERLDGLSRFNGDLSTVAVPRVIDGESAISASRLEAWAGCPRRYFLGQVLGLGSIDAPDEIVEISALDRGSMWHQILEDFIAESLPGQPHAPASPSDEWTEADRNRLHAHADRAFAEYESQGRTGRPLLWEIEKEKLRTDLDRFLESDNLVRAEKHLLPDQVEMAIGFAAGDGGPPTEPAKVELADGRIVRLRGFADRVDRVAADGSPVVFDYKTGSDSSGKKKIANSLAEDPVLGGDKLQLGVYAEAARQHYGSERASAWYWFTSDRGNFSLAGYPWTTDRQERFRSVLTTIVDGIESGLHPPNPGDYDSFYGSFQNCRYCDFDIVCRRDRDAEFAAAVESGRMVEWLAMREPPPDDEEGAA